MAQVSVTNLLQFSLTDLASSALRLVGSLASGEVPTASELSDVQLIANQMLDAWTAERLSVPAVDRITLDANGATLSLKAGQQAYLLGQVGGSTDLYLPRPTRLERVSIMYSASQSTPVELPMEMLDDVAWQGVVNKSTPSLLPQVCFNDLGFPNMTLNFWPIPTQANPIVLYDWRTLSQFVDTTTKIAFLPAYPEAIRYNLAVRLAAEFPGDMQKFPLVAKIAAESKARIMSFNTVPREVSCDEAILGDHLRGNIFTSSPNRSHRY